MITRYHTSLLLAIVFTCGSSHAQEKYLEGLALAEQGRLPEAHALLEGLDYDRDGDVLLNMAGISYRQGNPELALEELGRLEKQFPAKGSYLMARIYAETGQDALAVNCLRQHLGSRYRLPQDIILLDESFESLESSPLWKKLWQNDWYTGDEMLLQEVRFLDNKSEFLNALELLDRRLAEGGESADLLAARGKLLFLMSQKQGSLNSYNKAIRADPNNAGYYRERADVFRAMGDYTPAAEDLERACRIRPEQFDLLLEAAGLYRMAGDLASAQDNADKYLGYFPDDPEGNFVSGNIRMDAGKYFEAIDRFNRCLKADRSDPRFFKARGKCYLSTSTLRYAEADFGMALDLDPEDAETWYMKGMSRVRSGDRDGALTDWEHAARLGSREAMEKLESYGPR